MIKMGGYRNETSLLQEIKSKKNIFPGLSSRFQTKELMVFLAWNSGPKKRTLVKKTIQS